MKHDIWEIKNSKENSRRAEDSTKTWKTALKKRFWETTISKIEQWKTSAEKKRRTNKDSRKTKKMAIGSKTTYRNIYLGERGEQRKILEKQKILIELKKRYVFQKKNLRNDDY